MSDFWFQLRWSKHTWLCLDLVSHLYRMCKAAFWSLWKINDSRQIGKGNQNLKWGWSDGGFLVFCFVCFCFWFLIISPILDSKAVWVLELCIQCRQKELQERSSLSDLEIKKEVLTEKENRKKSSIIISIPPSQAPAHPQF